VDGLGLKIVGRLRGFPGAELVTTASDLLDRIGEPGARLFIVLAIGMYLAPWGRPRTVLWLLAAAATSMLVNPLLKLAFAATRPDMIAPLVASAGYSFPSGHAAGAMTLYGAIAWLFRGRVIRWFCAAMILATGLSRVWLGVHRPSDVVGGWIEGLALLALMARFLWPDEAELPSPRVAQANGDSHIF
jgi:undecaprenyl-diphosphatase